jgi:hypothetical protein
MTNALSDSLRSPAGPASAGVRSTEGRQPHGDTTDIPLTDNCRRLAGRMRPVLARNAFRPLSGHTSISGRLPAQ